MRALALAAVLSSLLAMAPGASAVVPGILDADTERVGTHGFYEFATQRACSSYDPLLGAVSTDLTSTLRHVAGPSGTTYTMHLDAVSTDPACAAIDFELMSAAAWPTQPDTWSGDTFTSGCGANGWVLLHRASEYVYLQLSFSSAPAECALPFQASAVLVLTVHFASPSAGLVCAPVVFPACTGASAQSYPWSSCGGSTDHFSVQVVGFEVVYGRHGCDWNGKESGSVGDSFGFAQIVATEDACTLYVGGAIGDPAQRQVECPAEVGALVYGVDWGGLLP